MTRRRPDTLVCEDGFGNLYIVDFSGQLLEIVPEPGTYVMILIALMPMAWRLLRRSDAIPQMTSPMP